MSLLFVGSASPAFAHDAPYDSSSWLKYATVDIDGGAGVMSFDMANPHLEKGPIATSPFTADLRTVGDSLTMAQLTGKGSVQQRYREVDEAGDPVAGTDGDWTTFANLASMWELGSDWASYHKAVCNQNFLNCHVQFRWGTSPNPVFGEAMTIANAFPPDPPENLSVTGTSSGGKLLTYDQVAALAHRVEFAKADAVIAVAVARAESSFYTKAVSYTGCCHGLWQINSAVHETSAEAMFGWLANAEKAQFIFDADGWDPWEAYTGPDGVGSDGPYLEFIDKADAAVDRQWATNGSAYDSIASAPSAGNSTVVLEWDEASLGPSADGYIVQRSDDDEETWQQVGTTGTTEPLGFTDDGAAAGATVFYRVKGFNDAGQSDASNVVSVVAASQDPNEGCESQCGDGSEDPSGGGENEEGEGTNCGLNVFCWIKAALAWAFIPGDEAWGAWEDFYDDLQVRPPFSVIAGGLGYVFEAIDDIRWRMDVATGDSWCYDIPGPASATGEGDEEACLGNSFTELVVENGTWVGWLRFLLTVVLIWMTSLKVWRILATAFGSSSGSDGEAVGESHGDTEDDQR